MNSTTDIIAPDGQFRWDFLKCMDLKYPSQEDFDTTHVYKGGEVVLKGGDADAVHALCVQLGLKTSDVRISHRDITALQTVGYLVESIPNMPAFYAARNAYGAESARREADFKRELFAREGLTDNPKADACYAKAYESAHAHGLAEVANAFIDLAELIR